MNDPAKEAEANAFAMELLMPKEWILRDLAELGQIDIESDPRLEDLAKKYQVSFQVMMLRIAEVTK